MTGDRNDHQAALRVLIVEDEALIAMLLEDILTDLGCMVVGIAASAESALRCAASGAVDVALMDVDINGPVDGVGAAQGLLSGHGVRSVFVTARAGDGAFRERAAVAAPLGFVDKPYRAADISGALGMARRGLPLAA